MATSIDRRRFLTLAGSSAAALVLAGCGTRTTALIAADDPVVGRLEKTRRRTGARVVERKLVAAPVTVDLAGRQVATWAYGSTLPGAVLRARVGDVLRVDLTNGLPEATTIHWPGLSATNSTTRAPAADLTVGRSAGGRPLIRCSGYRPRRRRRHRRCPRRAHDLAVEERQFQ